MAGPPKEGTMALSHWFLHGMANLQPEWVDTEGHFRGRAHKA